MLFMIRKKRDVFIFYLVLDKLINLTYIINENDFHYH